MTETTQERANRIGLTTTRKPAVDVDNLLSPPAWLRLLRPHQWVKNAFVAAPLFLTPATITLGRVWTVLLGVLAFSLLASAVYVLNDYMDRDADRLHPAKCKRPIASGEVTGRGALFLLFAALAGGLGLSFALSPVFGAIAVGYFVMNIGYSLGLKHVSIIDVMIITMGFMLRVYAGAALIKVQPSVWIVVCTGMVAMFLALAKRRDDLTKSLGGGHRRSLEGYSLPFLDASISIVLAALLISYTIFTTDPAVVDQLGHPRLYLTIPFVLAGILRYLQIALVEERSGTPTAIVLTDRFLIAAMGLWAVSFALLVHL